MQEIVSIERLLCLDVRNVMLSPLSQPVLRPLYNEGCVVLRGVHHHMLCMLMDTLTLVSTSVDFCPFPPVPLHSDAPLLQICA